MTTTLVRPGPPSKPPSPPLRRRRRNRVRRLGASSFGPLILSTSIVLVLGRLISHDLSRQVLVPLLASIVVADVVTAVAMRVRANVFVAAMVGWVVALLGLALMVDPSLANPSSPLFLHLSVVADQLRAAHDALANDGTPLPNLSGVILIFGAIGAAASALTRAVWAQQRRIQAAHLGRGRGPLSPCLAPSLAIFIYSTLVSAEQDRVAAIVSYFLGVLVFIALADHTARPRRPPGVRGQRRRRVRLALGAAAAALVMALLAVAAGTALSGMRLNVFHVTPPTASSTGQSGAPASAPAGQGVPQHLITGISLVDHLLATEVTQSHTVIFRATSPVTTYWQVGVLTSYNGSEWLPSPSVRHALGGSSGSLARVLGSGALPSPNPARTFTAQVAITNFASRLFPAPPHTVAVQVAGPGARPTIVGEQGVLAPKVSAPGTKYSVTAALDTSITPGGDQLSPFDPRLAPYVALPSRPALINFLAHAAVGSASTPAAEAQALVNWFRSGRFRYTLSPPPTHGSDPLIQFLTVTKAGYCQQFAGAYGVLARELGIPTRLAVGFTAGQGGAGGTFTVTGADAHVWPQVYLGPDAGWVSVEPTPPSVAGSPAAEGVVGATRAKAPRSSGPKGTPTSAVPRTTTTTTSPSPKPPPSPTRHRHPTHRHSSPSKGASIWWISLLVVVGLVLLAAAATVAMRRRRASAEAALPPDQRVVRAWERALGALGQAGLSRRTEETPSEYAARVRSVQETSSEPAGADAVGDLAVLVELACYTPRPCTAAQATDAHALAIRIIEANRPHRNHRRRGRMQHQDRHPLHG